MDVRFTTGKSPNTTKKNVDSNKQKNNEVGNTTIEKQPKIDINSAKKGFLA